VFPSASIKARVFDRYPVMLTVRAVVADGETRKVWSGSQKLLFRKRAKDRAETIALIGQKIRALGLE
jgi:hypothetical protein